MPAALRLPRIALAEVPPVADQQQQRDPVEHGAGDHRVERREEPMVLREHRRPSSGQVGAHGDADGLVLLDDLHNPQRRVGFEGPHERHQPCLGQGGDDVEAGGRQCVVKDLGSGRGGRHEW